MRSRRVRTIVVLAPVLVAVLVAVSLTACGRDRGPAPPGPATPLAADLPAVPPAAPATPDPTRPAPATTTRAATTAATTGRSPATTDRPPGPRLLFGMGPEANLARTTPPVRQAPVQMLTSWYNGPGDLATLAVFHQLAPNARVSLSWGGWQARWDDRATRAGRSLFRHFADVLRASDFQSFQAMATDTNTGDIRAMVRALGAYGPVMLAHYKPDNGSGAVFAADLRAVLTDRYLAEVTREGLFAMSFMDGTNLAASPGLQRFVRGAVHRYAGR